LQQQVQSAEGQTQAIQASAQITSEVVSQIQALRQTVMVQTNAQTAYYATQVQNEASAHAELLRIVQSGKREKMDYGHSGEPLQIPDF
jgi:P-type conjugative transfer protein TrbJ